MYERMQVQLNEGMGSMKKHADNPFFQQIYPELAKKYGRKKKAVESMFG